MQPWLSNNLGKSRLNPDPPNGIDGQCVNAASSWSMAMGGPELSGTTAWDIWSNFRSPFFQAIPVGPGFAIESEDIVFYYPNNAGAGTASAGHVDIAADNITATGFRGADTDWNGSPLLQYVNHTLNGVAGVFRHQGEVMLDRDTVEFMYLAATDQYPTDAQYAYWIGRLANELAHGLYSSNEGFRYKANHYDADLAAAKAGAHTVVVDGVIYKAA
jgi:hypothetical protein